MYVQNSQRRVGLFQSLENGADDPAPGSKAKLNSMVSKSKLYYAQECHKHLMSIVSEKKTQKKLEPTVFTDFQKSHNDQKRQALKKSKKIDLMFDESQIKHFNSQKHKNSLSKFFAPTQKSQIRATSLEDKLPLCLNPAPLRKAYNK
jgi:hypothetical protein